MQKYPLRALQTDETIYEIREPPIRLATYKNMRNYEKEKLHMKWLGAKSPISKKKIRKHTPTILAPKYITVEYSPYIDDENAHLRHIQKTITSMREKSETPHMILWDQIQEQIEHLYKFASRDRAKVDFLYDFIRMKTRKMHIHKITTLLFKSRVLENATALLENGLYIIRENGVLTNMLYSCVFRKAYWTTATRGAIDLHKMFPKRGIRNLYVQRARTDVPQKVTRPYFEMSLDSFDQTTPPTAPEYTLTDAISIKPARISGAVYFIRIQRYPTEKIPYDILHDSRTVKGTVRVTGVLKIYFY